MRRVLHAYAGSSCGRETPDHPVHAGPLPRCISTGTVAGEPKSPCIQTRAAAAVVAPPGLRLSALYPSLPRHSQRLAGVIFRCWPRACSRVCLLSCALHVCRARPVQTHGVDHHESRSCEFGVEHTCAKVSVSVSVSTLASGAVLMSTTLTPAHLHPTTPNLLDIDRHSLFPCKQRKRVCRYPAASVLRQRLRACMRAPSREFAAKWYWAATYNNLLPSAERAL